MSSRTFSFPKRAYWLALWILQALWVASYHEPWRDEAQAWLAVRSAESLHQLLYHASLELTGPLYYLLLWPFARLWPAAFPGAIFWISWMGTLLAVSVLLFNRRVPLWISVPALFGYLLGFEFAVIARLYGWGLAFLFLGISADMDGRKKRSLLFLSLSILTQLNFVYGVFAWVLARIFEKKTLRELLSWVPLAIPLILLYWNISMAGHERVWSTWFWRFSPTKLGTSLIAGFVQSPGKIGWGGILLSLLVFYPLDIKRRVALAAGLFPFALMFLLRADTGMAASRHASPLFAVWIFFCALSPLRPQQARTVALLLALSCLTGLEARWREGRLNYSDGLPAAKIIEADIEESGNRAKIFARNELYAFVIAARLNEPIYTGLQFVRVDFPAFTQARELRQAAEGSRMPWKDYARYCYHDENCYIVWRPNLDDPPPPQLSENFKIIYEATPTFSDESIRVYKFEI